MSLDPIKQVIQLDKIIELLGRQNQLIIKGNEIMASILEEMTKSDNEVLAEILDTLRESLAVQNEILDKVDEAVDWLKKIEKNTD